MAAAKQFKAPNNRQPTLQSNPPPAPVARHNTNPPEPTVNGKKKKKKKSKAKSADTDVQGAQTDDDMPHVDPPSTQPTNMTSPRRTGLSPELESVHLSTTASLSASAAAAARLNATAAAQAELLATANDLYRRMDSDAIADDEDYWAALPTHIKNFVKMTYSTSTNPNINASERSKAQSMLAIAHQMIQSGVDKASPKGGQPPGAYPSLPFDPAIFSDPAFGLAMEQTLATSNSLPPAPGQPPRGPLPHPSVVLLNEYNGDEHQDYDYSEEEVDENVEDHEHETAFVGYDYRTNNNGSNNNNAATDAIKKKSKKKKKKGGLAVVNNTTPAAPPVPPAQQQQPPASRPAPPSSAPLPSSRAAGKQPMSYTNTTLPATTQNAPQRTTKTTNAKTPASGHYHHPSPASSQTSHSKTNVNSQPNTQNNKLWSTNSNEERERIKEFWLGLGEEERRALVKVEKEAVLKKMKEQQKHSCSCAVCGRKRCVHSLF